MKWLYFFGLIFIASHVSAQIPQPAILSMQGIGGENSEYIQFARIIETFDSGFILTFQTASATGNINTDCTDNTSRYIFNKYNKDGTILEWQKCNSNLSDTYYKHLFPLQGGEFVLGGMSYGVSAQNFMIKKEGVTGNTLWEKQYGGSGSDILRDMAVTEDGGYVMLGTSSSIDGDVGFNYNPPFNTDIWMLKLDSSGNKQWSRVLGGSTVDEAYQVIPKKSGYYVIASTSSNDYDCTGNHGQIDLFVANLDDTGGRIWVKCYGGSDRESANKVWAVKNNSGGLTIATDAWSKDGDVIGLNGSTNFWILDIDSNGTINWSKCYGVGAQVPYGITKSTDGSLWVTGASFNQGGDVAINYGKEDVWTIKIDSVGNLLSAKVMGSNQTDRGLVIHPLDGGGVVVAGIYGASGTTGAELPPNFNGKEADVFIARFAPWTTDVLESNVRHFPMRVFPNPTSKELYIEPEQPKTKYDFDIVNTEGKTFYKETNVKGSRVLSIKEWSKGVYFFRASTKSGNKIFTTIMIQ